MAYFTVNLDSDSVFDDADQELSTGSVGADDGDSPTNVSFVQALKHKYCEESLTSLYKNTSRKRSSSAELGFLQNVVLGGFEITCAGLPKEGLVTLCPNVVDLDLAKNELDCWSEVLAIMTELPCLKFVNLSFNKLKNDKKCINSYGKSFPLVENLVLNGTEISWQDMAVLAKLMPRLKELHLCGNGYNEVEYQSRQDFLDAFSSVQCIRLNNNNIVNWKDILPIGVLPSLTSLILSENPLKNVEHMENIELGESSNDQSDEELITVVENFLESVVTSVINQNYLQQSEESMQVIKDNIENENTFCENELESALSGKYSTPIECETKVCDHHSDKPFASLNTLCVSETNISDWNVFTELTKFPKLNNLRIKGIKLVEDLTSEERRQLFLASLPRIKILNGSEVSGNEREKAEIHYVRYFADEESPPNRYHELTKIYGKLEKNYKLYMRKPFKRDADIKIMYNGKCVDEIHVKLKDAIGKLKSTCSNLTSLHRRHIRMFHMSKNVVDDNGEPVFQELFLESLPMSRFDIMDGDEIYVEKKQFEYYR